MLQIVEKEQGPKNDEGPEPPEQKGSNSTGWVGEPLLTNIKRQLVKDIGNISHVYYNSLYQPAFGIGHVININDPEYGWPYGRNVSVERIESAFLDDLYVCIKIYLYAA